MQKLGLLWLLPACYPGPTWAILVFWLFLNKLGLIPQLPHVFTCCSLCLEISPAPACVLRLSLTPLSSSSRCHLLREPFLTTPPPTAPGPLPASCSSQLLLQQHSVPQERAWCSALPAGGRADVRAGVWQAGDQHLQSEQRGQGTGAGVQGCEDGVEPGTGS